MHLTDLHIELVENGESHKENEHKIAAVLYHYEQAIDKNNPNRERFPIQPEMNGTIMNKV